MSMFSSQSEDSDSDLGNDNFLEGSHGLRRTKQNSFLRGDDNYDEIIHDSFEITNPLPDKLNNMLQQFQSRNASKPYVYFNEDIQELPVALEPSILTVEGASIYLNNTTALVPAKYQNRQYIHSWINLASINNIEATRAIMTYLTNCYYKHAKWTSKQPNKTNVDINWNSVIRPTSFNLGSTGTRVFHYIGLGFPPPRDGKICTRDTGFNEEDWKSMGGLRTNIQNNCLYIFDCDKAYSLKDGLTTPMASLERTAYGPPQVTAMFACGANEVLHIPETLPQNLFSCILLDPTKALQKLTKEGTSHTETFLQLLIHVFTESIALDFISPAIINKTFRGPPLNQALWRHYILSQRLMRAFGITVHSLPELPDCSEHPLWQPFEYALRCEGNSLQPLAALYRNHFMGVAFPATDICAVISSLMKSDDLYETVMCDVASFMRRSPAHCGLIAPYLDARFICGSAISAERSIEGFRAWATVISGILLALPGNSKSLSRELDGSTVIQQVKNPETDDVVRSYLTSVFVSLCDGQTHFTGFLGLENSIEGIIPELFDQRTSSTTRLWYAILLRAALTRSQSPRTTGPLFIHYAASLLMRERDLVTRAMAVAIIASLISSNAPEFNAYLMELALPAVADGSSLVRAVAASTLFRFLEESGQGADGGDAPELPPILSIDSPPSPPPGRSVPELPAALELLLNDPSPEVRDIVRSATALRQPSDLSQPRAVERLNTLASGIQRTAHASLFCTDRSLRSKRQRYPDGVLADGGLELLEALPPHPNSGAVSALAFDGEHCGVAFGSTNGTIVSGGDRWRVAADSVTALRHVARGVLAAGTSRGQVFVCREGVSEPIDSFQVCTARCGLRTSITGDDNCAVAHINSGNTVVVEWDLAALQPVSAFELERPMAAFARKGNNLLVATVDSDVFLYDTRTNERVQSLQYGARNRLLIRVGWHCGCEYAASDNGPCALFRDGRLYRQTDGWSRASDVILHPTLPYGLTVGNTNALVDPAFRKIASMDSEIPGQRSTKCCIDGERALAAIGTEDGYAMVWRLPPPTAL